MAGCSIDELYDTIGALVEKVTGRPWWRKGGIQGRPTKGYATVFLVDSGATSSAVDVVEVVDVPDEELYEVPWGTTLLNCKIEFFSGSPVGPGSAMAAAIRFRNSLMLSERFFDLWKIAGLSGGITVMDVSQIFRADNEGRSEVRFNLYANIFRPLPLPDTSIYTIESEVVTVYSGSGETITEIQASSADAIDLPYLDVNAVLDAGLKLA